MMAYNKQMYYQLFSMNLRRVGKPMAKLYEYSGKPTAKLCEYSDAL